MQEMADRLQDNTNAATTMGERLKQAMRRKLYERLQDEISQMQSVKGFQGNYNKLALSNLINNTDKAASNHSLLMYLSANLFHKPKFPEFSILQTLTFLFCRPVG